MTTVSKSPVSLEDPAVCSALAEELAALLGAQTLTLTATRLSGGAIQENWALQASVEGGALQGLQRWVLRTDAPSSVSASLGRQQEYAVLRRVVEAGVRAPKPLLLVEQSPTLQRPYFLMEHVLGDAAGHRLTRARSESRPLLEDLAQSLARLHALTPQAASLDFLQTPKLPPTADAINHYRGFLDTLTEPQPVLEWGLRWCELNQPEASPLRMIHRDFRTGNYLVEQGRLSAVLDWEFTSFGDPREDLGWFSARCWRFAAPECEAGGIGPLDEFLAAYTQAGGMVVSAGELVFWQVLAHIRWGVIALQQAQRHLSGQERSLELALTGRMLPELDIEILHLTAGRRQ